MAGADQRHDGRRRRVVERRLVDVERLDAGGGGVAIPAAEELVEAMLQPARIVARAGDHALQAVAATRRCPAATAVLHAAHHPLDQGGERIARLGRLAGLEPIGAREILGRRLEPLGREPTKRALGRLGLRLLARRRQGHGLRHRRHRGSGHARGSFPIGLGARFARPRRTRRLGVVAARGLADPGCFLGQHGLLQPELDVFGRLRLAEQEPLHDAAAEAVQDLHLAQVFHAFGDHAQTERAGQGDDGRDHRGALRRHAEVAHEAAVDLQLADGQGRQIGQRRVAGAEVVDRDLDADLVEPVQRRDHVLQVLHQARLGDLELDRVMRHAVGRDRVVDVLDEVGALEEPARQVDGDRIGEAEVVLPDASLARRLADRPFRERNDEPGLFGERNEVARRHEHPVAAPAHQRLGADHARAAHVDLGLIVKHQLVALDRLVQRALELELLAALAGEVGTIERGRVATRRLHRVHGDVGIAQQVGDGGAVAREDRDADARRDEAFLQADHDRLSHHLEDSGRDALGVVVVGDLGQQRDELVAAEPADRLQRAVRADADALERALQHLVGMAHARAQAPGDFHQQLVAGAVAERVVDDLEAVEVDQQQRDLVAEPAAVLERALGAPDQLAPVRQAREGVEVREMADPVLGKASVRDVLDDAGVADQVAVLVELRLRLDVDDALAAVDEAGVDVGREHRASVDRAVGELQEGLALLLRHHPQQAAEGRLVARAEAEHAQALDREHRAVLAAPPVEAAHAGEVLRARQARLAALELDAGARGPQQVAQTPGEQAPLARLDEEVGGAGLVGAGDRGVVVEAGQHQHRQRLEAGQDTQLATGLEAVEAGHDGVEDDDVGQPVGQNLDGRLASRRLGDREALILQRDRGQQQVDFVVVDEKDFGTIGKIVGRWLGAHDHVDGPGVSICVTACSTAASSRSIVSRLGARSSPVPLRIEVSISAQILASARAPMLADDDFSVWTTWRMPCMSLRSRASLNCSESRVAEVSNAFRTRSTSRLLPDGSRSRRRASASASSVAGASALTMSLRRDGGSGTSEGRGRARWREATGGHATKAAT